MSEFLSVLNHSSSISCFAGGLSLGSSFIILSKKALSSLRNLLLRNTFERLHFLGWHTVHDIIQDGQNITVRYLAVRRWKWPEKLMVPHEYPQFLLLMVGWYVRFEDKAIITIDQRCKLHPERKVWVSTDVQIEDANIILTIVPKDQMSVGVSQPIGSIASGLRQIGAPITSQSLAQGESSGTVFPQSPSWTSVKRMSPLP